MSHPHRHKKPSRGFTLIELLLYVSIASIMLLVTFLFLSTLLESRVKNQTIAEVDSQGVQVMQLMTQTIRNANGINTPATSTSASTLALSATSTQYTPTVFDLSSGVVRMAEGAGSAVPLTNVRVVVSGLTFSNLSGSSTPGVVRVQFTLTVVNNSGRNEYNYSKTFIGSAALRQP